MKNYMLIGALLVMTILAGCSKGDSALEVLKGEGYTNINITGYRFFGCGDDDRFHTGFTAKGPTGRDVSGTVCQGFLKGGTVRLD